MTFFPVYFLIQAGIFTVPISLHCRWWVHSLRYENPGPVLQLVHGLHSTCRRIQESFISSMVPTASAWVARPIFSDPDKN